MNTETQLRLIKKKVIYLPVGGKLYRTTKTLEEVIVVPCYDLTGDSESTDYCEAHRDLRTNGCCEAHQGLHPNGRESTTSDLSTVSTNETSNRAPSESS